MEASPLTRQPQPEVFTPKIIHLYESLFKHDDDGSEKPEGFWTEFFLHRPDRAALRRLLNDLGPDDVLHFEARTNELFARAVGTLKTGSGAAPSNALDVCLPSFASFSFLTLLLRAEAMRRPRSVRTEAYTFHYARL